MRSPPVKVYSESHQRQRRLQPVRRTKTQGRPMCDDSPWMEWKISVTRIAGRIGHAGLLEAALPEQAGIAMAAGEAARVRVITRMGQRIIDAQRNSFADDLRLSHADERRDDARLAALHAAARAGNDDALERFDELRPAVRIPAE